MALILLTGHSMVVLVALTVLAVPAVPAALVVLVVLVAQVGLTLIETMLIPAIET